MPPDEVGVLHKALDLLECLADGAGWSVAALCAGTRISKPAAYRILNTLSRRGYVTSFEKRRRYRLGPAFYGLARALEASRPLVAAARPAMLALREAFGETVNIGVLCGGRVLYLDILESEQGLRTTAEAGSFDHLHATGLGKAILASLPADDARRLLERAERPAKTPRTLVALEPLMAALAEAAARGYALDDEENEAGARCIAAPVLDFEGRPVAALSVSGPAWRLGDDAVARIGERVAAAARETRDRLLAADAKEG